MTRKAIFRIRIYKQYLRRRIKSLKDHAYKIKLKLPTAKELAEKARESAPGVMFTNVARDIRMLTEPGENYDAEFDLLYRGQVVPEIIERYSETLLAKMIKNVVEPSAMDERLADLSRRSRPDNRPLWEDL